MAQVPLAGTTGSPARRLSAAGATHAAGGDAVPDVRRVQRQAPVCVRLLHSSGARGPGAGVPHWTGACTASEDSAVISFLIACPNCGPRPSTDFPFTAREVPPERPTRARRPRTRVGRRALVPARNVATAVQAEQLVPPRDGLPPVAGSPIERDHRHEHAARMTPRSTFEGRTRIATSRPATRSTSALYRDRRAHVLALVQVHRPPRPLLPLGRLPDCLVAGGRRARRARLPSCRARGGKAHRAPTPWPSARPRHARVQRHAHRRTVLPVGFYYKTLIKPKWAWPKVRADDPQGSRAAARCRSRTIPARPRAQCTAAPTCWSSASARPVWRRRSAQPAGARVMAVDEGGSAGSWRPDAPARPSSSCSPRSAGRRHRGARIAHRARHLRRAPRCRLIRPRPAAPGHAARDRGRDGGVRGARRSSPATTCPACSSGAAPRAWPAARHQARESGRRAGRYARGARARASCRRRADHRRAGRARGRGRRRRPRRRPHRGAARSGEAHGRNGPQGRDGRRRAHRVRHAAALGRPSRPREERRCARAPACRSGPRGRRRLPGTRSTSLVAAGARLGRRRPPDGRPRDSTRPALGDPPCAAAASPATSASARTSPWGDISHCRARRASASTELLKRYTTVTMGACQGRCATASCARLAASRRAATRGRGRDDRPAARSPRQARRALRGPPPHPERRKPRPLHGSAPSRMGANVPLGGPVEAGRATTATSSGSTAGRTRGGGLIDVGTLGKFLVPGRTPCRSSSASTRTGWPTSSRGACATACCSTSAA